MSVVRCNVRRGERDLRNSVLCDNHHTRQIASGLGEPYNVDIQLSTKLVFCTELLMPLYACNQPPSTQIVDGRDRLGTFGYSTTLELC